MTSEIKIHRMLKHPHVVQFHNFFDDDLNVYIVLELCRKRVSRILLVGNFHCRVFAVYDGTAPSAKGGY